VSRAATGDAPAIVDLLERLAPDTLPVPEPEVRRRIHRFRVIREGDRVVAVAALAPLDRHRLELRSVAVDPDSGGRGLGTLLVARLQREAQRRGRRLQCVTLNPGFFERMGFVRIPLDRIPPKPARNQHPTSRPRVAMEWLGPLAHLEGDDHDDRHSHALHHRRFVA
jgi:N-acetylglutamate synthase-like GNAT family acetyltransferase